MTIKLFITSAILLNMLSGDILHTQWHRLNTTGNVPHLKNSSMIYDQLNNRIVVYGGRKSDGSISDELWSMNLLTNNWSQIFPVIGMDPNPAPRYTHNAYYDGNMYIWSGQGNSGNLMNDVWVFEFTSNRWHMLWPDGNIGGVPLKRYGTASVYEPITRKFTTFAGFTTSGRFEDTWTFDVVNAQWHEESTPTHPPKRCLHSGVYADNLRKFIIYGGQDAGPLDDIWYCDLTGFQWTNVTPVFRPPGRFWTSAVYIPDNIQSTGSVVIFGGLGSSALGDMWKFSLSTNSWESVSQGAIFPGARWGHSSVYIPSTDKMLVFGGEGDSLYSDIWEYSSASTIGINIISNTIPADFKLEQNYPNPFNPITKIRFNIPNLKGVNSARALLEIYDVLGNEIIKLVDQNLNAGVYETDFNGSNHSSGLYFCRLSLFSSSGSVLHSVTRKMILAK